MSYLYKLPLSGEQKKYLITKKPSDICWFLGLDYQAWQEGFKDREAIYAWVIPAMPRVTHETRKSLKHREMMQCFLQFARTKCIDEVASLNVRERVQAGLTYSGKMQKIQAQIAEDEKDELFKAELKKAFNGHLVATLIKEQHGFDVQGARLGAIMNELRRQLATDEIPSRERLQDLVNKQVE